jgi:DNA-binding transcriptional regulator GbsR (MarR family)
MLCNNGLTVRQTRLANTSRRMRFSSARRVQKNSHSVHFVLNNLINGLWTIPMELSSLPERPSRSMSASRSDRTGYARTKGRTATPDPKGVSAVQVEVIEMFVRLAQLVGAPKSVGEIYGLLFISTRPLALDDVVELLVMSKGSASQGLKVLRSLGAIRLAYIPGDRRDCYLAETELRKLVSGVLREQIAPHVESGAARLERIDQMLASTPGGKRSELGARVSKLRSWHKKARMLLPLVQKAVHE